MTTIVDGVERAQLVRKTGQETTIVVHFNPASLQYTVSNTLENKGSGNNKKQFVTQSSGKLTFDLVFDTTHTGEDVRVHTEQVAKLMEPEKKIPPVVSFEWGVYKFQGIVESYKETIDFFAPNGVPLRAAVNLTLASQDKVFEPTAHDRSADTSGSLSPDAVEVPSSGGAAGVGSQGGDPRAARDIAAANGQESLRFPAGDSFVVGGGSIQLTPPVAFASGGLGGGIGLGVGGGIGIGGGISAGISGGFGISGGAGVGISGGFGVSGGLGISGGLGVSGGLGAGIGGGISGGIGGGIGISGGAGASIGAGVSLGAGASIGGGGAVFGAKASARVTASQGAFAGLRAPAPERRFDRLRIDRLQSLPASSSLGTDQNASFQLGGQASLQGSASLRADVNGSARLSARIQFDEE